MNWETHVWYQEVSVKVGRQYGERNDDVRPSAIATTIQLTSSSVLVNATTGIPAVSQIAPAPEARDCPP